MSIFFPITSTEIDFIAQHWLPHKTLLPYTSVSTLRNFAPERYLFIIRGAEIEETIFPLNYSCIITKDTIPVHSEYSEHMSSKVFYYIKNWTYSGTEYENFVVIIEKITQIWIDFLDYPSKQFYYQQINTNKEAVIQHITEYLQNNNRIYSL